MKTLNIKNELHKQVKALSVDREETMLQTTEYVVKKGLEVIANENRNV